jgi:tRNA (guanine-N7-)-methyltransferase
VIPADPQRRQVRSYVRREGRMTEAQLRAVQSLLPRFALSAEGPLDLNREFGRGAPVYLEIGTGNGDCLHACAAQNPDNNYLGVEVHRPGVGHLLNQVVASDLLNVRVSICDVHSVLAQLPAECLSVVYIFFPDPWPKIRHHKRRLIQAAFLAALLRPMRRNGRVYIATDSADYAENIALELSTQTGWLNLAGRGVLAPRLKARIRTRFEARALADARAVHEFTLARAD